MSDSTLIDFKKGVSMEPPYCVQRKANSNHYWLSRLITFSAEEDDAELRKSFYRHNNVMSDHVNPKRTVYNRFLFVVFYIIM